MGKSYFEKYWGKNKGKGKKDKNKDKRSRKKANLRFVESSLSRKEVKANKKIILAPIDIPREFKRNREKCNHVSGMMSVDEYKATTPSYAAFTPMLDRICAAFDKKYVAVCRSCYDVVVDIAAVDEETLTYAVNMLYAAANIVVGLEKMSTTEIKEISTLKETLSTWGDVIYRIARVRKHEETEEAEKVDRSDAMARIREYGSASEAAFTM